MILTASCTMPETPSHGNYCLISDHWTLQARQTENCCCSVLGGCCVLMCWFIAVWIWWVEQTLSLSIHRDWFMPEKACVCEMFVKFKQSEPKWYIPILHFLPQCHNRGPIQTVRAVPKRHKTKQSKNRTQRADLSSRTFYFWRLPLAIIDPKITWLVVLPAPFDIWRNQRYKRPWKSSCEVCKGL